MTSHKGNSKRPVVYCLVPAELAGELHDQLRKHFRDEPGVEVVVEQRRAERRRAADRRRGEGEPPRGGDRRMLRAVSGRRVDERRAELFEVAQPPPLPRKARRHVASLRFVVRQEPSGLRAEDRDTARLVAHFQGGEREAFSIIYRRYFDRLYGYLRVAMRNHHDAEEATQEVFAKVFAALPDYERRAEPFRAWLYKVARNHAISELQRLQRMEATDPNELDEHRAGNEAPEEEDLASQVLDWISDRDLQLFVERLPETQKQILTMRHVMSLATPEIARALDSNPDAIRRAESRAVNFLRDRLAAVGRKSGNRERAPALTYKKQARVLRVRRYILTFKGPTG